ncbi:MAG: DUF1576 domain-containing protein [Oscillospiraceae bacterium]|nr:DUF1576 domain-containing protein [Oscillospiraceae bacterium]
MKKIRALSESDFLKLFFGCFALFFLVAAVCMPDRGAMFSGLWQILIQPCKVSTSYFGVGGFSATFLNMGLVAAICFALFVGFRAEANQVSTLAVILTTGFGAWGINIMNIWPSIAGVFLYALVKKEKLGKLVNAMLFSTGLAPLITDLMIRYPNDQVIGFQLPGIALSLLVGIFIGFLMPAGMENSPKVHKGFDLYSAAFPMGMLAFFLNATLFKTMGIALPNPGDTLGVVSPVICNTFCIVLFSCCIAAALLLGCTPKAYWRLLTDPETIKDFSSYYGTHVFLMNVGVFGLFILGYYNLIGAPFNGVTFGVVFCMLSTCNAGSHPGNVWPIMLGYLASSVVFGWLSQVAGGDFAMTINSQAIVVGLCYANGLSPISDKYGWHYGFLASVMHYLLVTSVPNLHGGFCLYNGGFTAALICVILVPELERFCRTKEERKALKIK